MILYSVLTGEFGLRHDDEDLSALAAAPLFCRKASIDLFDNTCFPNLGAAVTSAILHLLSECVIHTAFFRRIPCDLVVIVAFDFSSCTRRLVAYYRHVLISQRDKGLITSHKLEKNERVVGGKTVR